MQLKTLSQHLEEMKKTANILIQYSCPLTDTDEEELAILKQREIIVDGWVCIVYYGKSDYGNFFLHVVSLTNVYGEFLPFPVIVKVGKTFLGEQHLLFSDFDKSGKRTYNWILFTDKEDKSIDATKLYDAKPCQYRGLQFGLTDFGRIAKGPSKNV